MTYISWWFYTEPIYLWQAILNTTTNVYNLFSLSLLIRTLFYPWKKDELFAENPSLSERFQLFISNMVSRLMGAIVRTITVIAGLISTTIIFLIGLIFLCAWILLPVIIIFLFISGVNNLNG